MLDESIVNCAISNLPIYENEDVRYLFIVKVRDKYYPRFFPFKSKYSIDGTIKRSSEDDSNFAKYTLETFNFDLIEKEKSITYNAIKKNMSFDTLLTTALNNQLFVNKFRNTKKVVAETSNPKIPTKKVIEKAIVKIFKNKKDFLVKTVATNEYAVMNEVFGNSYANLEKLQKNLSQFATMLVAYEFNETVLHIKPKPNIPVVKNGIIQKNQNDFYHNTFREEKEVIEELPVSLMIIKENVWQEMLKLKYYGKNFLSFKKSIVKTIDDTIAYIESQRCKTDLDRFVFGQGVSSDEYLITYSQGKNIYEFESLFKLFLQHKTLSDYELNLVCEYFFIDRICKSLNVKFKPIEYIYSEGLKSSYKQFTKLLTKCI